MTSSADSVLARAHSLALSAQQTLVPSTPQLDRAAQHSLARGLPGIAIAPAQGAELAILCRMIHARRVLEIGTLGGYSTLWFAGAVPGIRVTSIERDPAHRDVALQNLAGVDNVEVLLGAALDVLPTLDTGAGKFDFVFIDADWENQDRYFDWAVRLTRAGGVIYVDNALRAIGEGEAEGDPAARALIERVQGDERVYATLISTVATHKTDPSQMIDGHVLAFVK